MGIGKKDLPSAEFIAFETTRQKHRESKLNKLKGKKANDEFQSTTCGVVHLQNIPYGFEERQIREYFSQFGTVTRSILPRSVKDGKPLGHAYVEFFHEEVAKIVAGTMNNYLMFESCLKCEVVPPEEVKPKMFVYPEYKRKWVNFDEACEDLNRPLTSEQVEMRKERQKKGLEKFSSQMKELGIEYDWGDLKANPAFIPPKRRIDPAVQKKTSELKANPITISKELEDWIKEFDFCETEVGKWHMNRWRLPERRRLAVARKEESSMRTNSRLDVKKNRFGSKSETNTSVEISAEKDEKNAQSQTNGPGLKTSNKKKAGGKKNKKEKGKKKSSLDITPVMLVDLEDEEISFKTPETQKVKKRVIATPAQNGDYVTPKRKKKAPMQQMSARLPSAKALRREKILKMREQLNLTL